MNHQECHAPDERDGQDPRETRRAVRTSVPARSGEEAAELSQGITGSAPVEEEAIGPEMSGLDVRRNTLIRSKQALMSRLRAMDWHALPVLGLWYVALARVRVDSPDACDRLAQLRKMAQERGLHEFAFDLESLRGSLLLYQAARDRARF